MSPREDCPRSDHRAPVTGGSCPCGMVTRVPAAQPSRATQLRDVLARCLDDGSARPAVDAASPVLLQGRVDRVLAAFADAGLVVASGGQLRPPA